MPEITRRPSTYDADAVGIGIVHIGLGAFHRAHEALYVERCLRRNDGGPWGICAANIRSNRRVVEQLEANDCRYHVAAFADKGHLELDEVASIRRALFARDDKTALLHYLTEPGTRIISLSVTEKGYCLEPATGRLLEDDPDIAHDLEHPEAPGTLPGLLVEALAQRHELGLDGVTILSCDNMPDNGKRTRNAVCTLAEARSPALARWIGSSVAFPSSMVDRIVPAMTPDTTTELDAMIGRHDPAAVACEAFTQWVIEDCFAAGRPDWEADGVEMIEDVRPYETMKLRMLNGAHSLIAYTGLLLGKTTVAEAIADAEIAGSVRRYLAEARTSLDVPDGTDLDHYADQLLRRFANDALEHRLSQIAIDGSQKIPQRWLEGAVINLERGAPIRETARAVAAWMTHVHEPVDDPMAGRLAACHRQAGSTKEAVDRLLGIREIFPEALRAHRDFSEQVHNACADWIDRQ